MLTDNDNMQAEPSDDDLPQPQPGPDIPRPQARSLLQTFSSFLTMTVHTLIFHRALYPRPTFLMARHNNLVVPQSRHPAVCAWINDAVGQDESERELAELERAVNWVDVDEAVRGALSRIGSAAAAKGPLPEDSTFTVAVELREDAPVPIGHPQHWIPSDPSLQYGADPLSGTPRDEASTEGPRGTSTIPLRTVDAGPLFWECWVEECPSVQPTTTAAAAAAAPSQEDSARESNST
ncbi:hypothetical protein VdG1_01106 [Verticillium dahliae VDG1]|nr:hypothetical protein VdG1_01106 [Verticillium dahliae VDG1]